MRTRRALLTAAKENDGRKQKLASFDFGLWQWRTQTPAPHPEPGRAERAMKTLWSSAAARVLGAESAASCRRRWDVFNLV